MPAAISLIKKLINIKSAKMSMATKDKSCDNNNSSSSNNNSNNNDNDNNNNPE